MLDRSILLVFATAASVFIARRRMNRYEFDFLLFLFIFVVMLLFSKFFTSFIVGCIAGGQCRKKLGY